MGEPTKAQDIVKINQTYGSVAVENRAVEHKVKLTYDEDGNLTEVEEVMEDNGVEYTRRLTELTYDEDGNLDEVTETVYARDGSTVEVEYKDTLTYDEDGNLESVDRSVS